MSEAIGTDAIEETDEVIAESTGLPFYSRLAIAGLLILVGMMVVIAIVQLGSGLGFIIINVAIALIVAGLI